MPNDRKYLFSDSRNGGGNFYLKEYSREEMNAHPQIRLMVANTMYRAAENYKNHYRGNDPEFLEPNDPNNTLYNEEYFSRFKHYENAADTPEIKDSNIEPGTMRGFVVENERGEPASIILAGITRDHNNQPRVMMGTIDTDDKYENFGYFSILFDETVKTVAQQNDDVLPKVVISMRNLTSRGQNFNVYTGAMKSRGFDLQGLYREIDPEKTRNGIAILPDDSTEDKIIFRMTPNFSPADRLAARKITRVQDQEAVFLQGTAPLGMDLDKFTEMAKVRFAEKIKKSEGAMSVGQEINSATNLQSGRNFEAINEVSQASKIVAEEAVRNALGNLGRN